MRRRGLLRKLVVTQLQIALDRQIRPSDEATALSAACASLRRQLFLDLRDAGLLAEHDAYRRTCSELFARGETERARLGAVLWDGAWHDLNRTLERPYASADVDRILGFGWGLTWFAAEPVGLDSESAAAVARLGALANLIVALYDQILDVGGASGDVLPRAALDAAAAGAWPDRSGDDGFTTDPQRRLLITLTVQYFECLDRLPHLAQGSAIRQLIVRAILAMYEAERATHSDIVTGVRSAVLRRKCGLPFVVMGATAWLVLGTVDQARLRWHIHWLYRLGMFFGWVDDAIDLEDDLRTGHPNRLNTRSLRQGVLPIAGRIVQFGRRLADEWHERVPAVTSAAVLLAVTTSWLGPTGEAA